MPLNQSELLVLRAELDQPGGHPDTGAYDADPQIAANQLNEMNRPGDGDPHDLVRYVWLERHRTNSGTDTANSYIYGRLKVAQMATEGDNPFGATPPIQITVDQLASVNTMLDIIDAIKAGTVSVSLGDTRLRNMLADLRDCGVMSAGDRTAIIALADNEQSRAAEIGLPRIRAVDVVNARALP